MSLWQEHRCILIKRHLKMPENVTSFSLCQQTWWRTPQGFHLFSNGKKNPISSSSQLDERRIQSMIKRWMASIHRVCRGVVESLIKRIDVNDGDNKHEDRQLLSCHGWTLEFSSLGTFIRHVELLSIRKQINKRWWSATKTEWLPLLVLLVRILSLSLRLLIVICRVSASRGQLAFDIF